MARRLTVAIAGGLTAIALVGCRGTDSAGGLRARSAWTRPTTGEAVDAVV